MNTYNAVCRRSGDWWAISVPDLKGLHTQVRRLADAEAMTRDAIALLLDVDPNSFAVVLSPEVPEAATLVADALTARETARVAEARALTATVVALRRLQDLGFTVRDAGRIIGLSPQRVSQLTSASAKGAPRQRSAATRLAKVRRALPPKRLKSKGAAQSTEV